MKSALKHLFKNPFIQIQAYFKELHRSMTTKKLLITGTGVQGSNNFDAIFQFTFECKKYDINTLNQEATTRYGLTKCTILSIQEYDMSLTLPKLLPKKWYKKATPPTPFQEQIQKIQYLQLS